MTCSKLILATVLFFSAGAIAKPVVIGEPKKGTPITTIQDGKEKVEITTTGIIVDDGKEEGDEAATATTGSSKGATLNIRTDRDNDHDTWIDSLTPIAFFLFLLSAILGVKYISSRNEQKRLELLKLMVEKGQPVPDSVVNSILTPAAAEVATDSSSYRKYRNAYGFSIGGFLLMSYALISHSYDGGAMICGLIFLCIGAGGLAGLYLPKRDGNSNTKA